MTSHTICMHGNPMSEPCEDCQNNVQPGTNIDAILAERGSRYGAFTDHAFLSVLLKNIHIGNFEIVRDMLNMGEEQPSRISRALKAKQLTASQHEALAMIAHKEARILNGDPNHADSWRDIAGYATLVADELEGKVR